MWKAPARAQILGRLVADPEGEVDRSELVASVAAARALRARALARRRPRSGRSINHSSKRRDGAPDAALHGHQNLGKQGAGEGSGERSNRAVFDSPLSPCFAWQRSPLVSSRRLSVAPGILVTGLSCRSARCRRRDRHGKGTSAIASGRIRVSTRGRRRLKRLSGGGHNILRLQSHSGGHAQYGPTWGKQLAGRGSGARIAAHLRGVFPFMKSTGVPLCTRCASACASQLVRRMQP